MTPGQRAIVAGAGFVAGGINGIVGGGSLVSFPALLAVGQPALTANVTSTVGIWPGYLGGVLGLRAEIADQAGRIRSLLLPTVVGGAAGSVLLLTTSPDAFEAATPYLILAACSLFAASPWLGRRLSARPDPEAGTEGPSRHPRAAQAATFAAAVYGAYFGAGLGIVLLAVLGTLLPDRLMRTNGLRGLLSLVTNSVAAAIFVVRAPVAWDAAGLLAGGSLVGGYAGARFSRRIPTPVLRAVVIAVGLIAAVRLLVS